MSRHAAARSDRRAAVSVPVVAAGGRRRARRSPVPLLVGGLALLLTGVAAVASAVGGQTGRDGAASAERAVLDGQVFEAKERARAFGRSVAGRELMAYQVGDPQAEHTVVLIGQLHGDEDGGRELVDSLRGAEVSGVNLWLVPSVNPDSDAADLRVNARGVDLNRNWGWNWQRSAPGSAYPSGASSWSEPETVALRELLRDVRPDWVVGLHQPLDGVDSDLVKDDELHDALVRELALPSKPFVCGGECHGTMTGWINNQTQGAAITVELPERIRRAQLQEYAAGLLRAVAAPDRG